MVDLVVVAANLHNSAAAAENMLGMRSGIALTSECQRPGPRRTLKRADGYRYHTGPKGRGSNDAGRETGVLVRDHWPNLGVESAHVTRPAPAFKRVGKERWGQTVATKRRGVTVAATSLHPVAAPGALRKGNTRSPLVRRHNTAVDWLAATIARHRKLGHEWVGGGDMNVREHWVGAGHLVDLIDRYDLGAFWVGLDVVLWTPGLQLVKATQHDIGSNHPALRVALNINREK